MPSACPRQCLRLSKVQLWADSDALLALRLRVVNVFLVNTSTTRLLSITGTLWIQNQCSLSLFNTLVFMIVMIITVVFFNVMQCCSVQSYQHYPLKEEYFLPQTRRQHLTPKSWYSYQITRRHIPADIIFEGHCCEIHSGVNVRRIKQSHRADDKRPVHCLKSQ